MEKDEIEIRNLDTSNLEEIENYCRCNWATFVVVDAVDNLSDEEFVDIAKKSQVAMIDPFASQRTRRSI